MRILSKITVIGIIFYYLLFISLSSFVYADNLLESGDASIEEIKAKLTADKSNYSTKEFVVTHYTPLDSAVVSDADSTKRLGKKLSSSSEYSPVQWYKEGDKWIFSAATEYRYNIAFQKFGKTYMQALTNRTANVDGDTNKPVYELVFPSKTEISEADRKSVLPLACEGRGMNYSGSPWSGSSGKIPKTGMIAADKNVLPQGTKLFVQGYGFGEVLDVGGAIDGLRLDLTVNNCELALKKGKSSALVAFEKDKAKISGSEMTDEVITTLLSKGVYDTELLDVSDKEKNLDEKGKYIYEDPFSKGEVELGNIGVDDREGNSEKVNEYLGNKYVTGVGLFLFKIAQVASIFLIGIIVIFWLLALLAHSGMFFANEWLRKLSLGSLDMYSSGGFGKLGIYTGFSFLVSVLIMTGLVPKFFAFVYYLLGLFIEFLSKVSIW
jgi:3D (Asp-Asp-Asp) domain-containing protein